MLKTEYCLLSHLSAFISHIVVQSQIMQFGKRHQTKQLNNVSSSVVNTRIRKKESPNSYGLFRNPYIEASLLTAIASREGKQRSARRYSDLP